MRAVVLFLFSIFTLVSFGQIKSTSFKVDNSVHDFGSINEVDGVVSHVFKITNTGLEPLIIYQITTSCGCTIPEYDKSPLSSGATKSIRVTFNPANQSRKIDKNITVRANVNGGIIPLRIKGLLTLEEPTIEDDYPLSLIHGIRMEGIGFWLEQQPRGVKKTHFLDVINTSNNDVRLSLDEKNILEWASVHFLDTLLSSGQRTLLVLKINSVDYDLWGKREFEVPIFIDGKEQQFPVTVQAIFIEDFSAISRTELRFAPKASTSTSFHSFSDVKMNTTLSYNFEIENTGKSPLIIRTINHSERVKFTKTADSINATETGIFTLELDTSKRGTLTETILIITNDPFRPVITLKLMANIV